MHRRHWPSKAHVFTAAFLLLSPGCGFGGSAHIAEDQPAQAALHAFLDAWKSGETPESFARRTLSIQVKDLEWRGGFKLIGYRAEPEGKLVGFDLNYPVALELKSPKGKKIKRTAVYTVTTQPQLLVARQEG